MKNTFRRALYITFGIIMLSLTIQENANAAKGSSKGSSREMARITPEQVQKLDRAMAIETHNGRFFDVTTVAHIRKTFGNLEGLKDGKEINLRNGDKLSASDIKFLYVERLKQARAKKLEIARTPHDEE